MSYLKSIISMLSMILLANCASHVYDPSKFQVHFQPTGIGLARSTAQVGEPYYFQIYLSGPLPTVPICARLYVDHEPLSMTCGALPDTRLIQMVWTPSLQDYLFRRPPPHEPLGVGEYDEALPYQGSDMAYEDTPMVRLELKIWAAEPDDTGQLKATRYLGGGKSRPIRLECRSCVW
jgi:hypothetical protein